MDEAEEHIGQGIDHMFTGCVQMQAAHDIFDKIGRLLLQRRVYMSVDDLIPFEEEEDEGKDIIQSRKRDR